MVVMFQLVLPSLVQGDKRSFGLAQLGRLTTVTVASTGRLRVAGIRINRVGIAVRFVEAGKGLFETNLQVILEF